MNKKLNLLEFLHKEQVSAAICDEIASYQALYNKGTNQQRIPQPHYLYYGKDVWEQAAAALLCGENLLLVGEKATGKNVLAENLAAAFARPSWNISFHINMDASFMIGTDTFQNGAVTFRPGPVYACAQNGGFAILDEINMARNEALAVLHSLLDYRRIIDVPGYDIIHLHKAARFIATMNYGYAGTRELNEALLSRFVVIKLPEISSENLQKLLQDEFPALKPKALQQFSALFFDLQKKCQQAEISSKAVDLRGLLAAIRLMRQGLTARTALQMGITNKALDTYEPELIKDCIAMRIPEKLTPEKIFED